MKATKIVSLVGGIAVGLSAVLTMNSCTPVDDSEEERVPADQSTGLPDSLADEIEPLNKRLESDALSEADLRVKGEEKDAETFATQSTGVPEEVAEEVDAITKRLMRDSLSEAGLRVKGVTEEGTVSANQSTGIPDEVAEEIDAVTKGLEADALGEAGLRVKVGKKGEQDGDAKRE